MKKPFIIWAAYSGFKEHGHPIANLPNLPSWVLVDPENKTALTLCQVGEDNHFELCKPRCLNLEEEEEVKLFLDTSYCPGALTPISREVYEQLVRILSTIVAL